MCSRLSTSAIDSGECNEDQNLTPCSCPSGFMGECESSCGQKINISQVFIAKLHCVNAMKQLPMMAQMKLKLFLPSIAPGQ